MPLDRIGVHQSIRSVFPPETFVEELADLDVELVVVGDRSEDIRACDAVVTLEHRDAFLDSVAWVQSIQAGVDRFPLDAFERAGVVLTNSTGIHGASVGEMVVGYMVALARNLHGYVGQQRRREWKRPDWDRPFVLSGKRVCVVGLGTLGRGIATRANALGMTVSGVKRTVEPVEDVETVYPSDELRSAIADARFVALAVPLTDETRHLVGAAELEAMREDAYLINVARGRVLDENALVDALRAGTIAGAALDVFETEPLPEDSPLWDLDSVLLTPHVAAAVRSYYEDVADIVRENVERSRAGTELTNRVV